jgi:hypothetical protein
MQTKAPSAPEASANPPDHAGTPPANPSPRQVLLGWFILFQIVFLVTSNLLGFIQWAPPKFVQWDSAVSTDQQKKRRETLDRLVPGFAAEQGHGWNWAEEGETFLRRWAQVSGQDQSWSLFAPSVAKATSWPAILFTWEEPTSEGPSIPGTMFAFDAKNGFNICSKWNSTDKVSLSGQIGLLAATNPLDLLSLHYANEFRQQSAQAQQVIYYSINEPKDIHSFVRIGNARLRRYEGRLHLNTQSDGESLDEMQRYMTRRMRRFVTEEHDLAIEYMRMRFRDWQREHPELPVPKQVILLNRLYRIRGPHEERGWEGPYVVPVVRWQPSVDRNAESYALEPFDFATQRFTPMNR